MSTKWEMGEAHGRNRGRLRHACVVSYLTNGHRASRTCGSSSAQEPFSPLLQCAPAALHSSQDKAAPGFLSVEGPSLGEPWITYRPTKTQSPVRARSPPNPGKGRGTRWGPAVQACAPVCFQDLGERGDTTAEDHTGPLRREANTDISQRPNTGQVLQTSRKCG